MDYEALKDQWSEVEDRDGVRLSWNVFPSSRMVRSYLSTRVPSVDSVDLVDLVDLVDYFSTLRAEVLLLSDNLA